MDTMACGAKTIRATVSGTKFSICHADEVAVSSWYKMNLNKEIMTFV